MEQICFLGTYTKAGDSKGIYVVKKLGKQYEIVAKTANEVENPTYLLMDGQELLYSVVNEPNIIGGLCSYRYHNGELILLDKMTAKNSGPCHLVLDQTRSYVVSSHYHAGNLQIHQVEDGRFIKRVQVIDHKKHESEGKVSHVHFATFTKNQDYIIVCDLGLDALYLYPFDAGTGRVNEQAVSITTVATGSGPRHLTLNLSGDRVYVLNELSGTINTYSYKDGVLTFIDEQYPVRDETKKISGAAVKLHPNGRYLYATQRGENILNCFKIIENGQLEWFANIPVEGEHPRDFGISKDGRQLWVANYDTNDISRFIIGSEGQITYTGEKIAVPSPVCVEFL